MTASNLARDRRRVAARSGRCCAACHRPLAVQRSTRRSCSERCRSRLYRRARSPFAHQRRIRNHFSRSAPRPVAASLDGYTVRMISRVEAEPIILKYEWLGSIGQAYLFAGLFSPSGDIQGVACFSNGYPNSIRDIIGGPALCLQRGACVHYAPHNARSFLINRACRLIHRLTGKARFFAYCDPEAGEYGGVYQASNWTYLGQVRRARAVTARCGRRCCRPASTREPGATGRPPACCASTAGISAMPRPEPWATASSSERRSMFMPLRSIGGIAPRGPRSRTRARVRN